MQKKTIIKILIIFILLSLVSFYLYYENTILQVSYHNIESINIPNDFNNYKIVQISDFHNPKSKKLTNDLIKEIKQQNPNIIVITGDFIDSRRLNIDIAINFIKEINNIAPIYFVAGNHESRISNYKKLQDKLKENNVIILDNKVETLKINDSQVNLIGVSDPLMKHNSSEADSNIIDSILKTIEYDKENYSILLSHRPELFDIYVKNELDLVLTGHAHGGQMRIPFIGGVVAPNQGLFPKYTSGLFKENKTTMIISRGIGNSVVPFRINNRPELIVITLNSK